MGWQEEELRKKKEEDAFWGKIDYTPEEMGLLSSPKAETPMMETPVLSDDKATPEDTEHAFNLGGWLKQAGSSVLGGVESGLSGMGDWMQKNPELVASMAAAMGRYAWDPDVGRDQFGTYSNKRAIWDSMNTGASTRLGLEKQRLADIEKKRGALMHKDGGFYNIKNTDGPDGPGYSINPLMRSKQQEPSWYEKTIIEESLLRGRPSTSKPITRVKSLPNNMKQDQEFDPATQKYLDVGEPYPRFTPTKPVQKTPKFYTTAEGVYQYVPNGPDKRVGSPHSQWGFNLPQSQGTGTAGPQTNQQDVTSSGIPIPKEKPWDRVHPKQQPNMQASIYNSSVKTLEKSREAVGASERMAQALKRFQYLNSIQETGSTMDRITDFSFDKEKREMVKITNLLTPQMRQGLPGSASDRDVSMFRGATVGIDSPKEINDAVATGMLTAHQNLLDRQSFMEQYFDANGHLQKAETYWKEYLEANPIFDPQSPQGSYAPNKNRKSFEEYFSSGSKGVPSTNDSYDKQPWVKWLHNNPGKADDKENRNQSISVGEGSYKGRYTSRQLPDGSWKWFKE